MKILQINKYLFPKGGSESYMFGLSKHLESRGHEIFYWGMKNSKNIIPNTNLLASDIDYNNKKGLLIELKNAINIVYNFNNQKKLKTILKQIRPDIVHIHNYNFQLSPSILPVIKAEGIKIIQTAHDSQMVCPNHRLFINSTNTTCTKCVEGSFLNCIINRCFDNSLPKSIAGSLESIFYHTANYYNRYIDHIISPSYFLANLLKNRITVPISIIPNFVDISNSPPTKKEDYILYVGRVSPEKGIAHFTKLLSESSLKLIIIGDGPDTNNLYNTNNIELLGRKSGEELFDYVRKAKFLIQPSLWYENCPMTVIESFACGTPVIAANHSGFNELIKNGRTGFLLDFSSNQIIKQIENSIKNYDNSLQQNCIEEYSNRFNPSKHIDQIENLYKQLLER